jgi:hypothetical protein
MMMRKRSRGRQLFLPLIEPLVRMRDDPSADRQDVLTSITDRVLWIAKH